MLRTLRIIVLALVSGVTIFALVVLSQGQQPAPPANRQAAPAGNNNAMLFSVLLPAMVTMSAIAMAFVVPPLITTAKVKQLAKGLSDATESELGPTDDGSQLMQAYNNAAIVRCALLEGPAFLNLFLYMSQHSLIALGLAGVLWLALIAQFPRTSAVLAWLETQAKRLADERSLVLGSGPIER